MQGCPLSPVLPGLIAFSPQGPRGRRDHRGLQAPPAPKATGARQERKARQGLLVRTLAWPFVSWGTGPGCLPCLSRRVTSYTQQHPNCCASPPALGPGLTLGCRRGEERLWGLWGPAWGWGCWAGGCPQLFTLPWVLWEVATLRAPGQSEVPGGGRGHQARAVPATTWQSSKQVSRPLYLSSVNTTC